MRYFSSGANKISISIDFCEKCHKILKISLDVGIRRKVQVSILHIESCIKLRAQGNVNEIVNVKVKFVKFTNFPVTIQMSLQRFYYKFKKVND